MTEFLGSKENPDYAKLLNLISTVARRYKKDEPQIVTEHVVIQPIVRNEETNEVIKTMHESAPKTISGRTLLGYAAIALGVVLLFVGYRKDELCFDCMLLYFIGFVISSFVGVYLVKKELVSTPRNLVFSGSLVATAFSLFYLLCETCWYGFSSFDLDDAGTGSKVFFIASVVVTCFLGWKFYKADESESPTDVTSNKSAKSTDTDRIRWNTELDGYTYKFAWLVSYVGMLCSALVCAIVTFNLLDAYDPEVLPLCLFGGSAVLSFTAACGLFRFKHYGYDCL